MARPRKGRKTTWRPSKYELDSEFPGERTQESDRVTSDQIVNTGTEWEALLPDAGVDMTRLRRGKFSKRMGGGRPKDLEA